MNCSDNVSSDEVIAEENGFSLHQAGVKYAHIKQLLPTMKWSGNDFVIIYEPAAAFQDEFSDALTVSPSCEYAGGPK